MQKWYNEIAPDRLIRKCEESEVLLTKKSKNPNGSGSIRKRSSGSWEGRYTNGFDKDGKQIQKSIFGATQKEVRQKLTQIISEIDEGDYIEPSKMTLREYDDSRSPCKL